MADFIPGKSLRVSLGGKLIWHAQSCGLSVTSKSENVATKDTNGDVVTMSGYNYTLSAEGLYAKLPTGNLTHITADDIFIAQLNGTSFEWEFFSPTGAKVYSGTLYVNQTDFAAPTDGNATWSHSFMGSGDILPEDVED